VTQSNKEKYALAPTKRKDGTDTLPARGYSWEPFLPDHVKSMIHGGNSPRVIEAVARIVRSAVVEQAPWLLEPIFGDSLERYCRAEARARLLADHIFRVSDEQGPEKIPVRLWESAVACDNAASRCAADLGLTPLSRAKLAALTTSTEVSATQLAQLGETGKAIRAKRTAALEALEADVSDDASDATESEG
jgi:hypothetical protein